MLMILFAKEWVMQNGQNMTAAVISEWIKTSVIPSFTIVSVKYFKQIPGLMTYVFIVHSHINQVAIKFLTKC